jgi:branched-chain amino acid transport system substrate-binding protein
LRKNWIVGLALAAPLALAACGGSAPPGTPGAGGGGGGTAGSGQTIKIASLHPLSGSSAADGQQMDNGAKLAVEAVNNAGGIASMGGAKLELLSADSKGAPETGQSEAQRLIQEGAVAIVGTYQSAVSQNVAAVAERNKVPFVIDVSSADAILSQGYQYTFRLQPSGTVLADQGAQYLSDVSKAAGKPAKKVAILHEQGPFGTAIKDTFTKKAQSLGMEVGPVASYDPAKVSDFTTQVTSVKASGADVLMVAGYYRDGVLVAKAVDTVKPTLNAVWGVANGAFDLPQFAAEAGKAGEGFFDANYHLNGKNPQTQALMKTYQDKYNDQIRTGAVLSYDAVRVIADSLNRAKSADPTTLRGAIAQTSLESLVAQKGPITFSSTGENQGAAPILMQVQGGKVVQTYPQDFAETQYRYPATTGQ